jgi:tetratricopeptide (TPR) repeat protein
MMALSTRPRPQAVRAGLLACAVSFLFLLGCASRGSNLTDDTPVIPPVASPAVAVPSAPGLSEFEARQRETLELASRRGRWGEVMWSLDVLQALRPNDTSLAPRRAAAERAAQEAAAERLRLAKLVQQRGDAEGAVRHYLEVLSLQPQHAEAADALRTLERERVARHHLGVSARAAFARNATAAAKKSGKANDGGRNDLEHASMMAAQGDVKGAIALLKPSSVDVNNDAGKRRLLADLHLREAELMWPSQRGAAVTTAERGLKIDPQHQRLRERLSTWREAIRSNPGPQAMGLAATGKEIIEGAISSGKSTR